MRHAGRAEAFGELVAHALELAEIEQPRLAARGDGLGEAAHRKGGDEGVGQLTLEPRDLAAERAPRGALVGSVTRPAGREGAGSGGVVLNCR